MSQFSFEYPWAFAFLVLFYLCWRYCKEKTEAIFFPHIEQLMVQQKQKSHLLGWLKWGGIVLAVVALASPVLTHHYKKSQRDGRDIVLVLDASDSMAQYGFDVKHLYKSKFEVVKEVVDDFISRRKDDRIGMVTFADISYIASPLTFERAFLHKIAKMQRLGSQIGIGKRTAINDAIVQAYALLSKSHAKSKVVILLTDGMDNMSKVSFEALQKMVKAQKVKLYTIGIGDANSYDGAYLKALAKVGGGRAYGAKNATMLREIYEQIDALERSKIEAKQIVEHTYLFVYPLFLAILMLLLFIYLRHHKGV